MRTIGMATVAVGLALAGGSATEVWGSGGTAWPSTVALVANLALAASGLGLARGREWARPAALGSAAAVLVMHVIGSFVVPWLGIAWRILGIGYPVVLLALLAGGKGSGGREISPAR